MATLAKLFRVVGPLLAYGFVVGVVVRAVALEIWEQRDRRACEQQGGVAVLSIHNHAVMCMHRVVP